MVNLKHHQQGQWNLEDFCELANLLLRQLQLDRQDPINPRLVRYYASQNLLDPPLKLGREARYLYRHLLQLLVVRRLLGLGFQGVAIASLTQHREDDRLEELVLQDPSLPRQPEPRNAAQEFLQGLLGKPSEAGLLPALADTAEEAYQSLQSAPPAPSLLQRKKASVAPEPAPPVPTVYQRYVLAEGVELHLAEGRTVSAHEQQDLLRRIERLLNGDQ